MKNLHGILFACQTYPGLRELVAHRTPASIPFLGRYRLIDFMLSAMVNAGMQDVGVVLHENDPDMLEHLDCGKDWDLSRRRGGLRLLFPPVLDGQQFRGRLDVLSGIYSYLQEIRQDYVVLADGDLVVNLPLELMWAEHLASGADITAVCTANPADVPGAIYFRMDRMSRISDVSCQAPYQNGYRSLEIYLLSKQLLLQLVADGMAHDRYSWCADVLQTGQYELHGFVWDGYAAQIRTAADYYHHSMELLQPEIRAELFRPDRPIYTRERHDSASYLSGGGTCSDSLVGNGCTVEGTVSHSILFHHVRLAPGTEVRDCILMQNTAVGENASLRCVIADQGVQIGQGKLLNGSADCPLVLVKDSQA